MAKRQVKWQEIDTSGYSKSRRKLQVLKEPDTGAPVLTVDASAFEVITQIRYRGKKRITRISLADICRRCGYVAVPEEVVAYALSLVGKAPAIKQETSEAEMETIDLEGEAEAMAELGLDDE